MDTLRLKGYYESWNNFRFSPEDFVESDPVNNIPQNFAFRTTNDLADSQVSSIEPNNSSSDQQQHFSLSHQDSVDNITHNIALGTEDAIGTQIITLSGPYGMVDGGAPDFPDACLKYMSDILMDGDFNDQLPATIEDYRALEATEKSLYDALAEPYPHPTSVEANVALDQIQRHQPGPSVVNSDSSSTTKSQSPGSSNISSDDANGRSAKSPVSTTWCPNLANLGNYDWIRKAIHELGVDESRKKGQMVNAPRSRKNHQRDDNGDSEDLRSSKHLTPNLEEDVGLENYDDILLCKDVEKYIRPRVDKSSHAEASGSSSPSEDTKAHKKDRSRLGKKKQPADEQGDTVDMRYLLTQCAQAVASFDLNTANEMLKRIRKHSTPYGDSSQRIAHYFANGLEARLSGTAGSEISGSCGALQVPLADFLKAYRSYVTAVPFKRTANFLANKTILNLARNASRIHIIDFGIHYGVQWPCFIQNLSKRAIGPPNLRITGIDYPEPGYQPASKVETTGRQLSKYCERFGVPFEYHPIAKRWEDIHPEDLKIDSSELLVVNCMYGASKLFDETVDKSSPRDTVLSLIRKLKPDLFVHGILSGVLNAPYFMTRFKEALFYFSAMFDLFEETMAGEEDERQLLERELYGKCILVLLACEAEKRVERPETYKQWQVRHLRAEFKQQGFDQELVKQAKAMLRGNYHKNFLVDEDARWILQGWKGKILFAVSCWKPA